MRNPTYALAILLCAALAALMTGCGLCTDAGEPNQSRGWFLMDTNGENHRFLSNFYGKTDIKVTADGQFVLYFDEGDHLTRYSIETGDTYTYDLPFNRLYYWPSYDVIYVFGQAGGTWDVYTVNVITGSIKQLTDVQAEWNFQFHISYDRNELYYSDKPDSLHTLYRLNLDTEELTALASNSYDAYREFGVSADGGAVYYFHAADDSLDGMYRLDVDTGQSMFMTTQYGADMLQVGSEERFLLWSVSVIMLDDEHMPIEGGGGYYDTSLLSNRYEIVYTGTNWDFRKINVITGEDMLLAKAYGFNYWVSIEGNLIIYSDYYNSSPQ